MTLTTFSAHKEFKFGVFMFEISLVIVLTYFTGPFSRHFHYKQSVYLSLAEPRVLHARVPVRDAGEVAASASGGGVLYPRRGVVVLLPESGGLPVKCGAIVMSDAPDISHGRYL